MVVLVSPETSLAERIRYEILGFPVLSKTFPLAELMAKVEALT